MLDHLRVLFSSQAAKAWIAGLATVLGAYIIPIVSQWLTTLTPEKVSAYTGGKVDYALATVVIGAIGVIWTYVVKNRPA